MTTRVAAAGLTALCLLAGCTPLMVEARKLNRPPHKLSPRTAQQVEVFVRKTPEAPYTEVYMLEVYGDALEETSDVLRELRAKAGQLGCDGVVLSGAEATVHGRSHIVVSESTPKKGVCIVYNAGKVP